MLLELMVRLQEVDIKKDGLLKQRQQYLATLNNESARLKIEEARKKLEQFEQAVNNVKLNLKKKLDEIERLIIKQAEEEKKLYSSGISAREAEALQKDVQHLKERISALQDEVDAEKVKVEEYEQKLISGKRLLENHEKDYNSRIKEAEEKLKESESALKEVEAEIADLRSKISTFDPEALKIYDRLRQRYGGSVVCEVDRSTRACTGCYVELTLEAFELLAKETDRLHVCGNCGRILVMGR